MPLSIFGKTGKKVKYINLQCTQTDTTSRFAGIKILDFTNHKDTIGKGAFGFGGVASICFEHADALNAYLSKRIVFGKDRNNAIANDTLLIALYAFWAETDVLGAGVKAFHFDADCYIGGNGKYRFAGVARYYHEMRNYRAEAEGYISAITDSMIGNIMRKRVVLDSAVVDEQFILNGRSKEMAQVPVYHETVKDGLYRTARDFFNNTPSETGEIRWITSDMMEFRLVSQDGSKTRMNAKDYFAICVKGHLYKASGKGLGKVKFVNGNFYLPVMMKGVSTMTNYEKYGSSGLLGMALGGAMDSGNEVKVYNCKIDFRTGEYYQVLE